MKQIMFNQFIKGKENITMNKVDNTLKVSQTDQESIKEAWQEVVAKHPTAFDGKLWRYEGFNHQGNSNGETDLFINVSPIVYSVHNVLRHKEDMNICDYPNPASINAVMVTADGYIPIGVKGKTSDQKGLGVMGAGFLNREKEKAPEHIFDATAREITEETGFDYESPFDISEAALMGAIYGSNHDTTFSVHVPLAATKNEVGLGNQEHSDLLFLSTEKSSLDTFLNEEGMHGIKAVDHLLGDVELYMRNKYDLNNI